MEFDPYRQWLHVDPRTAHANHYELLGLTNFEPDPERIRQAYADASAKVRPWEAGEYADVAAEVLHELTGAYLCLRDADRKLAYDRQLRARPKLPSRSAAHAPPMAAGVASRPTPEAPSRETPVAATANRPFRPSAVWIAAGSALAALLLLAAASSLFQPSEPESLSPPGPAVRDTSEDVALADAAQDAPAEPSPAQGATAEPGAADAATAAGRAPAAAASDVRPVSEVMPPTQQENSIAGKPTEVPDPLDDLFSGPAKTQLPKPSPDSGQGTIDVPTSSGGSAGKAPNGTDAAAAPPSRTSKPNGDAPASTLIQDVQQRIGDKRYSEARQMLEAFVEKHPKDLPARFYLGLLAARINEDFRDARLHFEQCVRDSPDNVACLNNLACVEVRFRNVKEAALCLRHAVQLEPREEVVQNVGRLLATGGTMLTPTLRKPLEEGPQAAPGTKTGGWRYMVLAAPGEGATAWQFPNMEDPFCLACGGTRIVACPNRYCKRGSVQTIGPVFSGAYAPDSGKPIFTPQKVSIPCSVCRATGVVPCPFCQQAVMSKPEPAAPAKPAPAAGR